MEIELSIVVPCFNEQDVVEDFYERMTRACRAAIPSGNYEIVFVNDGSSDGTLIKLERFAAQDRCAVVIDLFRNHGHQLAVTAGLEIARGKRVMLIDADLQDPPELLGDFMTKMDQGYDVVYGQRDVRAGESMFKKVSASAFYRVLGALSPTPIPPDTGDFRLMSRAVVDQLNGMPEAHRFIRGMVAWIGGRQAPLVYARARRHAGETKYTLAKMMRLAVDALTGFSVAPLRISIAMSAMAVITALALMVYVVISFIRYDTAPGWASLGIIMLAFSAVQLLCIGILGEYVGRNFMQSKGRPLTHIRTIIRHPQSVQDSHESHLRG